MKVWLQRLVAVAFVLACALPSLALAGQKRVAVLDFKPATTFSYSWFNLFDITSGIPDQLVTKLVESNVYTVIERERLADILGEQDLGQSGRIDATNAIKLGKLLGADVLITGSITSFGFDGQAVGTNAFGIAGNYIPGIAGSLVGNLAGNLSKDDRKAKVELDVRMINTTTGQIIGVAHGVGMADRKSFNVGGLVRNQSYDFEQQIMSEAIKQAVGQLTPTLISYADKVVETAHSVDTVIADVTGGIVTLNAGSSSGLKKGDKLAVKHVVKVIKDPATGKVIRELSEEIATLQVTQVGDGYAEAKVLTGQADKVKAGLKASTVVN
jgi:curli biogenesis system outer membrane secretion channel CsgG